MHDTHTEQKLISAEFHTWLKQILNNQNTEGYQMSIFERIIDESILEKWTPGNCEGILMIVSASLTDIPQAFAYTLRREIAMIISLLARKKKLQHRYNQAKLKTTSKITHDKESPITEPCSIPKTARTRHEIVIRETEKYGGTIEVVLPENLNRKQIIIKIRAVMIKMVKKLRNLFKSIRYNNFTGAKVAGVIYKQNFSSRKINGLSKDDAVLTDYDQNGVIVLVIHQICMMLVDISRNARNIIEAERLMVKNRNLRLFMVPVDCVISVGRIKRAIANHLVDKEPLQKAILWQQNKLLLHKVCLLEKEEWTQLNTEAFGSRTNCKNDFFTLIGHLSIVRNMAHTVKETIEIRRILGKFDDLFKGLPAENKWNRLRDVITRVIEDLAWDPEMETPSEDQRQYNYLPLVREIWDPKNLAEELAGPQFSHDSDSGETCNSAQKTTLNSEKSNKSFHMQTPSSKSILTKLDTSSSNPDNNEDSDIATKNTGITSNNSATSDKNSHKSLTNTSYLESGERKNRPTTLEEMKIKATQWNLRKAKERALRLRQQFSKGDSSLSSIKSLKTDHHDDTEDEPTENNTIAEYDITDNDMRSQYMSSKKLGHSQQANQQLFEKAVAGKDFLSSTMNSQWLTGGTKMSTATAQTPTPSNNIKLNPIRLTSNTDFALEDAVFNKVLKNFGDEIERLENGHLDENGLRLVSKMRLHQSLYVDMQRLFIWLNEKEGDLEVEN